MCVLHSSTRSESEVGECSSDIRNDLSSDIVITPVNKKRRRIIPNSVLIEGMVKCFSFTRHQSVTVNLNMKAI